MTNSVKIVLINRGNEVILGNGGVTTDLMEDNNKISGSAIGGVAQSHGLATATDFLEAMNLLGETTGRVSSAESVDKKDTFRGFVELVSYEEVPNT